MDKDEEEDRQALLDAQMKLLFVQDASRLIDQMAPVSHELSLPIKARNVVNHYLEEYQDLYRRKARK